MAGIQIDEDAFDEARLMVVERALKLWSREGRGRGARRDNQQAMNKLKEIAGRAHPERMLACQGLAEMLYNGAEGITANNCESMKWYLKVLDGPAAHRSILMREGNRMFFIVVCNNMLEVGLFIVHSEKEGEGPSFFVGMQEKLRALRKQWKGTAGAVVILQILGEVHWLRGERNLASKCFTKVIALAPVAEASGTADIIGCVGSARRLKKMMDITEDVHARAAAGEKLDVEVCIAERMEEVEREYEEAREAAPEKARTGVLAASGIPVTRRESSSKDTLNLKLKLKPGVDIADVTQELQEMFTKGGVPPSIAVNGPTQHQKCCGCGAIGLYLEKCACKACGDPGLAFCSSECQALTWKAVTDSCPRHSALPPPPPPTPPEAAAAEQQQCCGCGVTGHRMSRCLCTKCGEPALRFCSRECQLQTWKAVRKSCPQHSGLPTP